MDEQIKRTQRDLEKMHVPQVCSYVRELYLAYCSLEAQAYLKSTSYTVILVDKLKIGTPLQVTY